MRPAMSKRVPKRKRPALSCRKPDRRQMLGGLAGLGITAAGGLRAAAQTRSKGGFETRLRDTIRNVVVIFAENRSFNNLFSNFPGVQHPLSSVAPERLVQHDRDGKVHSGLPPIWGGLVPTEQMLDGKRHQ